MTLRGIFLGLALVAAAAPLAAQAQQSAVLVAATPQNEAVVSGPVSNVTIIFSREVDLVHVDVELPDQSKLVLFDIFDREDPARKGKSFTLALPAPLTAGGQYYINYAVSVTNPGSTDAIAGFTGFEIEAEPATEPAAEAE
ncbi:MAG: copper resistance protein CopC [Sphingomonadales bacterium]|nr:copper resistance protein CopC [Sphingomonadales bacterium]